MSQTRGGVRGAVDAGAAANGKGKVLVVRGGAVGDFVLTLPALRLLRESLPAAHIEVLGYRPIIDLAVLAGYADAVRSIEYAAMAGFFAPGAELEPELADYFASFSVVISYLFDPDGFFRGNLGRAGVETIVSGPHRVDEGGAPAARQLAAPLEGLAMFLGEGAEAWPRVLWDDGVARDRLAWHPGSGGARKVWDPGRWVEVFVELGVRDLMLVSGEAEDDRIGEVEGLLRGAGIGVEPVRGLALCELAQRLRSVGLFFGHDSGVSHLAAACGVPCLLVFGPTDPSVWAPPHPHVAVVRAADGEIESIDGAAVVAAAREMLGRGGGLAGGA